MKFDRNEFDKRLKESGSSETFEWLQKEALSKITDELHKSGKLLLDNVFKKIGEYLKKVPEYAQNIEQAVEDCGGLGNFVAYLWNCEEKDVEELTLESVIKWIKAHYDKTRHSGGCLYVFNSDSSDKKEYHICFLNKNSEPLLDGSEIHLIVHANRIDDALREQIGNKNMVVFR